MPASSRVDKWLCAVRLFKTRGIAAEMCAAGKVKRHGQQLKAATTIRPGDLLDVPFPDGPGSRSVVVLSLVEKRLGAPEARACYDDRTSAAALEAQRVWHSARTGGPRGRPTKKNRRMIDLRRGFFE